MLDQYHLEQDDRIYARSAVILTVQIFYNTIDTTKSPALAGLFRQTETEYPVGTPSIAVLCV